MADSHKNFAYSTVLTAPSPASSGTTIVLASGGGALMPTPPFNAVVWPASTQPTAANAEIVRVTSVATDTLTVTRTQENTSARTIIIGDQFAAGITAKALTDIETAAGIVNYSTSAQSFTAGTRTYLTGSQIAIPTSKLKIGTTFRWKFNITKTAAGSATSVFDVAFGTAGTVADTARVSFTKPAGTAVADEGWVEITAIVRGPLSASGVVVGEFVLAHNLASTGHATTPNVVLNTISATFDVTTPTFAGVCLTTGTADVITVQLVMAEAMNI